MNFKYTATQEKFIRENFKYSDRVLRAEFMRVFGWAPSFDAFRKKRQRMGLKREGGA